MHVRRKNYGKLSIDKGIFPTKIETFCLFCENENNKCRGMRCYKAFDLHNFECYLKFDVIYCEFLVIQVLFFFFNSVKRFQYKIEVFNISPSSTQENNTEKEKVQFCLFLFQRLSRCQPIKSCVREIKFDKHSFSIVMHYYYLFFIWKIVCLFEFSFHIYFDSHCANIYDFFDMVHVCIIAGGVVVFNIHANSSINKFGLCLFLSISLCVCVCLCM